MRCTRGWIALALLLAAPVLFAPALLAQTDEDAAPPTPPPHKSRLPQRQIVLPPLQSGPLSQMPMDQLPPAPANVSYQDGLLTISARNSTLGEILRDVRKLTGASIEIPPGPAANERVVTNLGPGEPRDVLAGLLNGSSFNYVMLGSSSDPSALASVLLTTKQSSGAPGQNMANANENNGDDPAPAQRFTPPFPLRAPGVPGSAPPPGNAAAAGADADDSKDDDDKDDDDADDQAQAQPGQPNVNGATPQDQQQATDPNQPNAGPKTPEQILQMLRHPQPGSPTIPQQQPPD